ncbi:class I SAM-dependent methyltransferase [Amycolatopsis alba]|nr:class I SAM-dependent methyltransferase [Amycolatopsis alba]
MMSHGRAPDGRSSYEILRDHVSGHVRVLDLGCGDGFLLDLLVKSGHQAAGVDLSSADLALARQRPSLRGVPLTTGRAQELPFADDSFDACVSHMAFMLMPDIDQVAAELARVLAPGGHLALIVSSGQAGGSGSYELFQKLIRPAFDGAPPEQQIPPLGDKRTLHRDGIDEILVPAGFSPIAWDTEPIDLGGTAEQVWSRLSMIYNFMPLDPAVVRSLEAEFLTQAAKLADADGRVPCTMNVHIADTSLSQLGFSR